MARQGDRAGSDGKFAIQVGWIGNTADVPELGDDGATGFMHRLRDELPAFVQLLGNLSLGLVVREALELLARGARGIRESASEPARVQPLDSALA